MKTLLTVITAVLLAASCDVQSGIAKKSVEKYAPSPTPTRVPTPVEEPIDPADVVQVDTSLDGDMISVNKPAEKKRVVCDKYNQVMVNGSDTVVTIKGACRKIVVNSDGNDLTVEAVTEIVFNGSENKVRYSRYANGKRPIVTDNKPGNITEKISAPVKN